MFIKYGRGNAVRRYCKRVVERSDERLLPSPVKYFSLYRSLPAVGLRTLDALL